MGKMAWGRRSAAGAGLGPLLLGIKLAVNFSRSPSPLTVRTACLYIISCAVSSNVMPQGIVKKGKPPAPKPYVQV